MISPDEQYVLTFNGEIYNFSELRLELEAQGETFRSRSDTEVLLKGLMRYEQALLPKLDAMFAFGFYDVGKRELLLARDIFGEKPLYYVDTPDYFAFASELHALTRLPDFDPSIDDEAIGTYLSLQYVACPQSIYRACRKLPPGHWLVLDATGTIVMEPYFSFSTSPNQTSGRPLDDLADELESLLITSVRRRLISDVPLGAFLSGGVDSATIAAIATRKLGIDLKTYSIGFEGQPDSEHHDARAIAHHLGTDHHEKVLTPDALSLANHIGEVLDEPNADTSCLPTYLVSQFARESVTVAMSGDGGDELFGGYGRYFVTVDEWQRKRDGSRALDWWRAGDVYLSNRILVFPDEELQKLFRPLPGGIAGYLERSRKAIAADTRPLLNVLREFDAATYMPGAVLAKVDRMSMQHSLEVRAPLLGIDIAKFAMKLAADDCYSDGQGKLVLKRVASRYLPPDWMSRPKRGFGLPMNLWSSEILLPALRSLALARDSRLHEWIAPDRLHAFVDDLTREFHPYRAWSLFILESWLRTHPAVSASKPAALSNDPTVHSNVRFGWRLQAAARRLGTAMRKFWMESSGRRNIGGIKGIARLPRRMAGASWRTLIRLRFIWSSYPDNHPDVIAEQALVHSRADASHPITLAFAYSLPAEKIEAYLSDVRVSGVVTKDGQHESYLPERLFNDVRVGRYWTVGWSLPAGSARVYLIGQWRLLTLPMLREALRGKVQVLRARCAYCWLGAQIRLLRVMSPRADPVLRRLNKSASRHAISTYRIRRRLARAILHLGPNFTWLANKVKGELRLVGWSPDRVFRYMLRQPLPPHPLLYKPVVGRIVLVCGNLQPGGAERQAACTVVGMLSKPIESIQLLCDRLSPGYPNRYDFYLPVVEAAGAKARQITTRVNPGERRRLPPRLIEVAPALPSGLVADVANLYWEFVKLRPEVVHAWLDWSNIRAGLAAVLAGVPKVLISGRNLNPSHFSLYDTYMDPAYKALVRCPNVIFLNNSVAGAHDYADWIGIQRDRITVIRNGIDFGSRARVEDSRGGHDPTCFWYS